MMSEERSTKIVNFTTPRTGILVLGHGHVEHALFILHFLFTPGQIRQIKYKAIMTKVVSSKIIVFIIIGAGGLMLRRGYKSHYREYAFSSTLSMYVTLIAIVFREYNAVFLCHC